MLSRYYLLFSKEFNTMLSERTSSCLMNVLKSLMRTANRGARAVALPSPYTTTAAKRFKKVEHATALI
jgi:hypothetical protein